ncbi:MutS-related protein [Arthrobacter sp. ISL-72]|uniref:MutS-related protein n=1 Tax=Arthrobacter sp. ISL-72 TaxID=2819114 RepID=UPI001BE7C39F|nr:hypothetical protein [Arthrobacter sp. ISL-72]MBT2596416.1 hypothetical protein [Arthrobacter sp. ISL-72]
MKAFLLAPAGSPTPELPANAADLVRDLALRPVLEAMAKGDEFLLTTATDTLARSLTDPESIHYRQQILLDCLENPATVRRLYALTVEAIEGEKKIYRGIFNNYPGAILRRAIESLTFLMPLLRRLHELATDEAGTFHSPGFTRFFAMITDELGPVYLQSVTAHLKQLKFRSGVLLSASLGPGNQATGYTLRRPPHRTRWQALCNFFTDFFTSDRSVLSFHISDRDESGYRALSDLRDRGMNLAANALAQSDDHILDFFALLRAELGFYVSCLNLHDRLTTTGTEICLPKPEPEPVNSEPVLSARGLYEPSLALAGHRPAVGNDLGADGMSLVMITGANEGGKSTFLRATGAAQLMMQAGMFVCAEYFSASTCNGLYTHFKREEDAALRSGKLDEELSRMNSIAGHLMPGSMVLFNESFAATNEREGSSISYDIIRSLTEAGVRVLIVTHLYDLAHSLFAQAPPDALFLQAERQADGRRTFKLHPGEPTRTSYGDDLYTRVFGQAVPDASPEPQAHQEARHGSIWQAPAPSPTAAARGSSAG